MRQQEIPGAERPRIERLDELSAAHLEATEELAAAKDSATGAKELLKAAMEEHLEYLETDKDGNHVYVYQDGDERTSVVLFKKEGIRCRKAPKLEIADEPEGDIG